MWINAAMTTRTALIGDTGFVGGNLLAQHRFDATFNSKTIDLIDGEAFDEVICAGVIAVKWWANQNAAEDWRRIEGLIAHLEQISCRRFVLISTVDVYRDCRGVDEDTMLELADLHPYGVNRARLEDFVRGRFPEALIVRLPALFGAGLKKNAIYDLIHDNRLSFIHPDSTFQWYPLTRLWADLARAGALGLGLVNLSVAPVSMAALAARHFPGKALGGDVASPSHYDMRSKHDGALGGRDGYVVTAGQMMDSLAQFLAAQAAR
jgi:nucleoside-diphosphate-sugar epimerase